MLVRRPWTVQTKVQTQCEHDESVIFRSRITVTYRKQQRKQQRSNMYGTYRDQRKSMGSSESIPLQVSASVTALMCCTSCRGACRGAWSDPDHVAFLRLVSIVCPSCPLHPLPDHPLPHQSLLLSFSLSCRTSQRQCGPTSQLCGRLSV